MGLSLALHRDFSRRLWAESDPAGPPLPGAPPAFPR